MSNDTPKQLESLTVGARVFYPAHGVASVTGEEEKEFGGAKQVFYMLKLDRGGTLMIPHGKVERAGVRNLVSAAAAKKLLARVKTTPDIELKQDTASRKKRSAVHGEALRMGSPEEYTNILQELLFRLRSGKLSSGEQRTMDQARAYFADEIGAALDKTPEQVEQDLGFVINK